jgi:hypothetical protein
MTFGRCASNEPDKVTRSRIKTLVEIAAVTVAGTLSAIVGEFIGAVGDEEAAGGGLFTVTASAVLAFASSTAFVERLSASVAAVRSDVARLAAASFLGSTAFVFLLFAPSQTRYIAEFWRELEPSFILADMVGTAVIRPIVFGTVVFAIALSGVMLINGVVPPSTDRPAETNGE